MKGHYLLWALSCLVVFISSGCGTDSSAQITGGPGDLRPPGKLYKGRLVKETRTIPWRVARPPDGDLIRVFGVAKWCVRYPKPRISRVDTQARGRAVFIKVFMTTFRRPKKREICAALEVGVKRAVVLSSWLGDRALYDSGVSPPEKRWPWSPR